MIEEYTHSWDQPDIADKAGRVAVRTTPEQALTGLDLVEGDRVMCTSCGGVLHADDTIWVYAYQAAEASQWTLTRWYCGECRGDSIATPTLGVSEALVEARLAQVPGANGSERRLCLSTVALRAFSPPREGASP